MDLPSTRMSLPLDKKGTAYDGSSPPQLSPRLLERHSSSIDAMRTTCEAKSFLLQLALLCLISTALSLSLPADFVSQQTQQLIGIRATPTESTPVTDVVDRISDHLGLDPMVGVMEEYGHVSPQSYPGAMSDAAASTEIAASLATAPSNTSMRAGGYRIAFEINRPPRVLPPDEHLKACTATLLTNRFENSYGRPAVTRYSPSSLDPACRDPTKWIFIVLGVTGSGKGRQYDRLGSVQLDGVEVLRTDNQEPHADGSRWRFQKEMNKYYDLFRTDRTLLFDLPNIVNQNYTSPLDYSLDLTVYIADGSGTPRRPPLSASFPVVLPLSKRQPSTNSFFSIGESAGSQPSGSTRLQFPVNARAALVEIYASGTAKDEFWYTNLPDEAFTQDGGQATDFAYGKGPLRELQVIIDGRLAGIAQPYPVIFTGGISPYLWRPSVAYGAFDQPTYYVDISPFIGQLTDGQAHDFTLTVVSAEQNQHVLSWFVSGNIQVMLDSSKARTTGSITTYSAPSAGTYSNGAIVSGNVSTTGMISAHTATDSRSIHIEGSIKPGSVQQAYTVTWQQDMTFSNENQVHNNSATTRQQASGRSTSTHQGQPLLNNEFEFDLDLSSQGRDYTLSHSYNQRLSFGQAVSRTFKEPTSQSTTVSQKASAHNVVARGVLSDGQGQTTTSYSYQDADDYSFGRENTVAGQAVTSDTVSGSLQAYAGTVQ